MGRLGAAKRRMLSLAERPSPEVAACEGVVPLAGAAEGIVGGRASMDGGEDLVNEGWSEPSVSQLSSAGVRARGGVAG